MTISLTKPSEGSVGWAAAINQNWTDIENAVNAGSALLSAQVNSVNGGADAWGNLHSYSVPAISQDGTVLEFSAIMLCGSSGGGYSVFWRAKLGGVILYSLPFETGVANKYEEFRLRIVRTTSSTALLTLYRISLAGSWSFQISEVTGLSWGSSQTLLTEGYIAGGVPASNWAEKLFLLGKSSP